MNLEKVEAARRHNGAASGMHKLTGYCFPENSKPLPQIQSDFLSARFGLDAARARLTAELVWGCR